MTHRTRRPDAGAGGAALPAWNRDRVVARTHPIPYRHRSARAARTHPRRLDDLLEEVGIEFRDDESIEM